MNCANYMMDKAKGAIRSSLFMTIRRGSPTCPSRVGLSIWKAYPTTRKGYKHRSAAERGPLETIAIRLRVCRRIGYLESNGVWVDPKVA